MTNPCWNTAVRKKPLPICHGQIADT